MASDFIPSKDADALVWMLAFGGGIQGNPNVYGLTVADASTIMTAVTQFQTALVLCESPITRTPGNINAKDTKRNAAENLCRQYAIQIKYNNGITDQQKIDIGVRPVNDNRSPVYCPQSSPLLNITGNTPGAQTLTFADALEPNEKRKPNGAAALQLFVAIKDTPTVNEDDAQFLGLYTKGPIVVAFQPEDDGKCATYFAKWCGKRGDTGQWSLPVSMRIAA